MIQKHHTKHHAHSHYNHHRPKFPPPILWERPYFPSWDSNVHYVNYHTQDDNYFDDYYNRTAHNDCCRYDSDGNLNANKSKLMSPPPPAPPSNFGAYCSTGYYQKPAPLHPCYSCERSASSLTLSNANKFNKVQRIIPIVNECLLMSCSRRLIQFVASSSSDEIEEKNIEIIEIWKIWLHEKGSHWDQNCLGPESYLIIWGSF